MKLKILIALIVAFTILPNNNALAQVSSEQVWTEVPDYRERLEVDPEFDTGSLTNSIRDRILGFFGGLLDDLGANTFLTELHQELDTISGSINTSLGSLGLEAEAGKLGLPNVQEVKQLLSTDTVLGELNDVLGGQTGTTYSNREKLYQQYLREYAQEYSENSALSLEGQSKIEAKIDSAASSAEQSLTIADDSSVQDISQNIMRNISNQLALDQQANVMTISAMQDAKVDRALGLQINSEALAEISKQNMSRERQQTGLNAASLNTFYMISIPGESN